MQKINFAYHVMMNKGLWDSISGKLGNSSSEILVLISASGID